MIKEFHLSGIELEGLEEKVITSFNKTTYTEKERNDIGVPVVYNIQSLPTMQDPLNLVENLNFLKDTAIIDCEKQTLSESAGIKLRIKRFLAKCMRWYILPCIKQQTCYNTVNFKILSIMAGQINQQQVMIQELESILSKEKTAGL